MNYRPISLAVALAFTATLALPGCDRASNLTEEEYIQKAKDLEAKGNLRAAIIEYKNAIQKNTNNAQARWLLGQAYLKIDEGAASEKELKKALELGVGEDSLRAHLGEAYLLQNKYQEILSTITISPEYTKHEQAKLNYLRAEALLGLNKLQEGCLQMQSAHDADPAFIPIYWGLSNCALIERNLPKAKEWLNAAIKLDNQSANSWVNLGNFELFNNNLQGALSAFTSALQVDPENLKALKGRITVNITSNQKTAAEQDLKKMGKIAKNAPILNYLHALLDFRQQKYKEAQDALQKVLQVAPDHWPSVLLAGTTAYMLGSYQQAETYLNRVLVNFPNSIHARKILAATRNKLNQPDAALKVLEPLISSSTKDSQSLALAGEAYISKGEPDRAANFLQEAASLEPKNASLRTQLGLSRIAKGDTQLAIAELENAASLDDKQYGANALLVLTYLKNKEYDKALDAINALEKKLPNNPVTHNFRGSAYLGKNDVVNARKSFEQAMAVNPAFFQAAQALARLDLIDRNHKAALNRFKLVLNNDKNNIQAMVAMADIAATQGDEKAYLDWLSKAIQSNPKSIVPRIKLVSYYLSKKDSSKALRIAQEGTTANPDGPAALSLLGTTQLATGKTSEATATLNQVLKKAPRWPEAYLKLAMAHRINKKPHEARTALNKALELQPNFILAQDALMQLNLEEGNTSGALHIARQMQTQRPNSPVGFDREAEVYVTQKKYPDAIKAYEKAISLGAGSAVLIKLHQVMSVSGEGKNAEMLLTRWLNRYPKDNIVRGYTAERLMASNRNQEAIAQYETLLKQQPNNIAALNNLAFLLLRENDPRALSTAELAIKLAPNNPGIQDTLGWILVEQGNLKKGLEILRKASSGAPKSSTVRYHLAVALARSGDKATAKKELRQILDSNKKFPEEDSARILLNSL